MNYLKNDCRNDIVTTSLVPQLLRFFSHRLGGKSIAPYHTLNLANHVGDNPITVTLNREIALTNLIQTTPFSLSSNTPKNHWVPTISTPVQWISLVQVHSNIVHRVDQKTLSSEIYLSQTLTGDALWSTDLNLALAILTADCVPILVAAKMTSGKLAIGAAHAGWRGTEKHIAQRLINTMVQAGCEIASFQCVIGPAIGPCCFTVGDDVLQKLSNSYPTAPDSAILNSNTNTASASQSSDKTKHRPHNKQNKHSSVNLWELNKISLMDAGVSHEQIVTHTTCTQCTDELFSYRRDGPVTGRQAAMIALCR